MECIRIRQVHRPAGGINVTTFVDREHALEAHQAILDFLEFQNHLRALEESGLAVASRLGLEGASAKRFAHALAERFITDPKSGGGFAQWLAEMPVEPLSPVFTQGPLSDPLKAAASSQSWVEFVISQIFLLFSAAKLSPPEDAAPSDDVIAQTGAQPPH